HIGPDPVISRAYLFFDVRANKRALLHSSHVVRVRPMQVTAGKLLLVQGNQNALTNSLRSEGIFFGFGAVAPEDAVRLADFSVLLHPRAHRRVVGVALSKSHIPLLSYIERLNKQLKTWPISSDLLTERRLRITGLRS